MLRRVVSRIQPAQKLPALFSSTSSSRAPATLNRHCAAPAATIVFTSRRFCSGGASSSSSTVGSPFFGRIWSLISMTAAITISSLLLVVFTWPLLDGFFVPALFTRSLLRGAAYARRELGEEEPERGDNNKDYEEETEQIEVMRLRELFSDSTVENALLNIGNNNEKKNQSAEQLLMQEEPVVVVLHGDARVAKSSIARRVALTDDHPVLHLNLRGLGDTACLLHGTLTYITLPMSVVGACFHSYVKILNAFTDVLVLAQNHQHVSSIFFSQSLGHVQHALHWIKKRRARQVQRALDDAAEQQQQQQQRGNHGNDENNFMKNEHNQKLLKRPLIVIDGIDQLLSNLARPASESVLHEMSLLLINVLLRECFDSRVVNLLLVCDSDLCLTRMRNPISDTSCNENNKNKSKNDGVAEKLASTDLLAAFPFLNGGRARFVYVVSRAAKEHRGRLEQTLLKTSNASFFNQIDEDAEFLCAVSQSFTVIDEEEKHFETHRRDAVHTNAAPPTREEQAATELHKQLVARVLAHDDVPPLLLGQVLFALMKATTKKGMALNHYELATEVECEPRDCAAVLRALELEGLVTRVVGEPLVQTPTNEKFSALPSKVLPLSFLASESCLNQINLFKLLADDEQCTLELLVENPRNDTSSSSLTFNRVSISRNDVVQKKKFLTKLSGCRGDNSGGEVLGFVDVASGIAVTHDEMFFQARRFRNGDAIRLLKANDTASSSSASSRRLSKFLSVTPIVRVEQHDEKAATDREAASSAAARSNWLATDLVSLLLAGATATALNLYSIWY